MATILTAAVPAALAVVVAEVLRVRSVWIHAGAGALTGMAAYFTSWAADTPYGSAFWLPLAIPAGLVGGVIYWVIAVHIAEPPAAGNPAAALPRP